MRITVTDEDIAAGIPFNFARHPVALALSRTTGNLWNVFRVWVEKDSGTGQLRYYYDIPEVALEFIARFNAGEKVESITFELPETPSP